MRDKKIRSISISEKPVGKVIDLSVEMELEIANSWFKGSEDLPEPWCRDIVIPYGAVMFFPECTTHVIKEGMIWEVIDENVKNWTIYPYFEEIVGEGQDCSNLHEIQNKEAWNVFLKTINVDRKVRAATLALAKVGCTHIFKCWKQRETILTDMKESFVIYAELAIIGGKI